VDSIDDRALLERLRGRFADPTYQPPLPPTVALQIYELSKKPETPFDDVISLLETDGLLAAEVLKLAQSPEYATRIPPRTLREAVSRLSGSRGSRRSSGARR